MRNVEIKERGTSVEPRRWEIRALGYLGLSATDAAAWRGFAGEVLGLGKAPDSPAGAARFKADARQWRLSIEPEGRDGIAFMGFEVRGPGEFAAAVRDLREAGVAIEADDGSL